MKGRQTKLRSGKRQSSHTYLYIYIYTQAINSIYKFYI